MPIDYKLKTLRRLFGVNNFFRFPPGAKRNVLGATSQGLKESDRPSDVSSAKDAESDRPVRVRASKSVKAGGGTPRAFFKEQAPRAIRNKSVGSQLNIVHLFEKQKMRVYYGAIRDEKFKKYVEEAKKKRFNTDAALLRLLELRLDTLLYRTSFARTPMEGRQWISHNQICVNGEPLNIKSAPLRPGDVISIRDRFIERATDSCMMNASMRKSLGIGSSWILSRPSAEGLIPWLEVDRGGLSAALVRIPTDDEVRALQHASLFPFIRDAQLNPHAAMRAYR